MLISRRSLQEPRQKQRLDTLQELIVRELDPELIFVGLRDARKFQAPNTAEARQVVAAAAFGNGESQLTRGEALMKTFPLEALMWMWLAEKQNVKNASAAASALAKTLSKEQLAEVEKRVKSFVPLGSTASGGRPN